MREILSKGRTADLNEYNKPWVEGHLIEFDEEFWIIPLKSYDWADDGNHLHFDKVKVTPETVCQYSGERCDLNNLPLFEGDTGMLKIEGLGEGKFEVVFYDGCFWFRVESQNEDIPFCQWKRMIGINVEKTGNIHDKNDEI